MKTILSLLIVLQFYSTAISQKVNMKWLLNDTIPAGTIFPMRNHIFYVPDYYPDEKAWKIYYDSLAGFINNHPYNSFAVEVHTDCRADSIYNIGLSQRRADSVRIWLIRAGADSLHLIATGRGENDPLIDKCKCHLSDPQKLCTEAEHQLNRRTTLRVMAILDPKKIKKNKKRN